MPKILKLPLLLPLLAPALLLGACQHVEPTTPAAVRFMPVPLPVQPVGEAVCDGEPCLSQAQADTLFNAVIDAACEANDKLAWLSDYYLGTTLPPSCGEGD